MRLRSVLVAASLLTATPILAQSTQPQPVPTPPEEEEADYGNIVVTGTRVRQGGAQDIRSFRSIAADVTMPRPEALTVEGLLGEHDLDLPATRPCRQLFCLNTEAMTANLPTRPDDRLFVGLGFTSNIDAERWQREPLNLVAVIDKSGSMSGEPLDLVRHSLRQIVGQLRDGDQLTIVLYGDRSHVHLEQTEVSRNRERILAAIGAIESEGSTNMEEGLEVGYQSAFATAPAFRGNTRVMLFTDEQPNVGATDADSFMGMAQEASRRGIGLTTIGVGVQFDAGLATQISSVRGGNLYFMSSEADVRTVFERQLDTMVSELAHDVRITMTPRAGTRITGVFGVPDGVMSEGQDGAMTITVPTAFLSTNGGGIFVSLGKASERAFLPATQIAAGEPLLDFALSYVDANNGAAGSDRLTVAAPSGRPSAPLQRAQLLVDQYLAMHGATTAYHANNNPREAYRLLSSFSARLRASRLSGLEGERRLVADLTDRAAFFGGFSGERPRSLRHLETPGTWRISAVEGFADLRRGDTWSFDPQDSSLLISRERPPRGRDADEYEPYQINERQIFMPESDLVLDYQVRGDRMVLTDDTGRARVQLRRVSVNDID